jgi:phage-related minor tail protein
VVKVRLTVLVQQGSQIADVFQNTNGTVKGFFGQVASGAASILTPMRLVAGGVLGLGAAALYIGNNWQESAGQIDRALTGIGARTGETVQSINKFSSDNASATGLSVTQARNIALEFTKTGNIAVSGLKGVGEAIHGYSVLTGKDATDATKEFASALSGDLVKGAEKINQTYGVLNSASLEYIRTLELQGNRSAAIQVIIGRYCASQHEGGR